MTIFDIFEMEERYFGRCKQCGKEIGAYYKSQLKTFCSHKCSNQWKWDNIRERKKYIVYKCACCGKEIKIKSSDHRIKYGQSVFYCCRKCWAEDYRKRKQKTCPICHIAHNRKSQTCCHECCIKLSNWKRYEKKIGITFPDYVAYIAHVEKHIGEKLNVQKRKKRKTLSDEETKQKRREYGRRRRLGDKYKEYMRVYLKEYNIRNKDKRNKRVKERMLEDSLYRFKVKVRKFICQSFKRRKESKMMHTEDVLGCSFEEFMNHICSLFRDGMTIDNYGEWQIDHIIPLSTAETNEDVVRLCHYTNLQPLWASENRAKSNKILHNEENEN